MTELEKRICVGVFLMCNKYSLDFYKYVTRDGLNVRPFLCDISNHDRVSDKVKAEVMELLNDLNVKCR